MRTSTLSLFCLVTTVSFISVNGANEIPSTDTNNGGQLGNVTDTASALRNSEILSLLHKLVELLAPPEQVKFFLYTHLNPKEPQQLRTDDVASVNNSNFNASHPTRFTIHGWLSSSELEVNTLIRDAYLSKGPHNIIAVNWVSESINAYDATVWHVPQVGHKVAEFIDFLAANDWVQPENITVAGHSLGAHVAGVAGRSLQSGQLHTIYGLDPASAGFDYDTSEQRLRSSDAYYVESIQTNAATSGYYEPIGKATFYVSGGIYQPGCGIDIIGTCSHLRAYEYLAEAIRIDGFRSIKCNSVRDALSSNCGSQYSETVRMGAPGNADIASGVFFTPVHPHPPFSYK